MEPLKAGLIGLGFLSLFACSTLKTSSLRDARVLKRGKWEIGAEMASAANMEMNTLDLAKGGSANARKLLDSNGYIQDSADEPLIGLTYSRGIGHGLQYDIGAYT